MRSLFARLLPFIIFGITLVLFIVGFILLSYILIAGAVVGLILFAGVWFKEKLFPTKQMTVRGGRRRGRTIDQ